MPSDVVMKQLQGGMVQLQRAFTTASIRRQEYIIAALTLREYGQTFPAKLVSDFDSARGTVLRAAADLDSVLKSMKAEEPAAYLKVIGAINAAMAKAPGVRTSSEEVAVIIRDALPAFPRPLLNPSDTPEVRAAVARESANYGRPSPTGAKLNGLGFLPAVVAPISEACLVGMAAVAPTGVGPLVVGVGCGLLTASVVVGSLYLTYKAASQLPRLVMAFSPTAAASMAEADRLEKAAEFFKATGSLPPEVRTQLAKDLAKQPTADAVPWAALALIGGLAAWFLLSRRSRTVASA